MRDRAVVGTLHLWSEVDQLDMQFAISANLQSVQGGPTEFYPTN